MKKVTALRGDTLDQVCIRHLGNTAALEHILMQNPNLAMQGTVLPMGTVIVLPDTPPQATKKMIHLWD